MESDQVPAIAAILEILENEGVQYIFCVPGGPLTAVFETLQERSNIRLVMAKHEGGAAFMAASYARASGSLGVCLGTSGPGATNALTGIASAHADSLPVLLLTGQVATNVFGRGAIQESSVFGIDLVSLFRPVTKLSAMLPSVERVPDVVRGAVRTALGGRPGAVHLNMPADLLRRPTARVSLRPEQYRAQGSRVVDLEGARRAAELLVRAQRPCLLAGHGVALSNGEEELAELARLLGAPVLTSPKGKGVFSEQDPLSLGVLGFGGHELAEKYIGEDHADLMLVVGSSMNEFVTNAWTLPLGVGHEILQIDVDPSVIGRNYPISLGLVGDARATLAALVREVRALRGADPVPPAPLVAELRAETPRYLVPSSITSDARPLKPQRLIHELRRALPDDGLLFVDNGTSIIWGVHYFEVRRPRTFFIDLGLASMGSAVAGVVGGALARPGVKAAALVGDAAFAMNGFEVHTAVEQKLDVTWLVLNNGGHGMVHQGDQLMRGRDLGASEFRQEIDSAGIARSLGARGIRVETVEELQKALNRAFTSSGPTVIDVVIDREELAPTLVRRVQTLANFMAAGGGRSLIGG